MVRQRRWRCCCNTFIILLCVNVPLVAAYRKCITCLLKGWKKTKTLLNEIFVSELDIKTEKSLVWEIKLVAYISFHQNRFFFTIVFLAKSLFKLKLFLNTSGCQFASSAVKSWCFFLFCAEAGVLIILPPLLHGAGCLVVITVSMSVWWLADCELFHALMQPLASWIIRLMMLSEWESGKELFHLGGLGVCAHVYKCIRVCVSGFETDHLQSGSSLCSEMWDLQKLMSFFI